MNFKRRTPAEEQQSLDAKDYTCGYDYLPWLRYKRLGYIVPIIIMFILSIAVILIEGDDTIYLWSARFFLAASVFLKALLFRDWYKGKRGVSL